MRIPSPLLPERADGLWRHTCFEVFVGGSNRHDYLEYNFSPSGQWQIYAFQDYRRDGRLPAAESPSISRALTRGALQLEARIRLPGAVDEASLRLGICAVLEDTDGRLSYWALQHPTGKPDFHDPATFILTPGETP
jgi:hypothetical protein